jgi:hypothetical protein
MSGESQVFFIGHTGPRKVYVSNISNLHIKKTNLVVTSKTDLAGVILIGGGTFNQDR